MKIHDRILFFNNNGTATIGWQNMSDNRKKSIRQKPPTLASKLPACESKFSARLRLMFRANGNRSQEYEGKLETASGRMTLVFKKIGKDWKVVHLHTSPDNPRPNRLVLPLRKEKINRFLATT